MDLSSLTQSLRRLKIRSKIAERSGAWFHRFDHCLRFHINEGSVLRHQDHDMIDRVIARRKEWGRRMAHSSQPGSWLWRELDITAQDIVNLHFMCDFLSKDTRDRKIMISGNWIYIYTNDVGLLDDIAALDFLDTKKMQYTRVKLIGSPGTIVQKNPKYQKRSFFRSMVITPSQRQSMRNFLTNQESARISPALEYALGRDILTRTMDYFFIDHDDDSVLIMLSLIVPNIIRKTLPIRSYK